MKNQSSIRITFKLAFVCGATLLPFTNINAGSGWNDIVEGLTDETKVAKLQQLTLLRDKKVEDDSQPSKKWMQRSRQLKAVTAETSTDDLKKQLGDRHPKKGPKKDKVIAAAQGSRNIIDEIETMEAVQDYLSNADKTVLKRLKFAHTKGMTTYINIDELPPLEATMIAVGPRNIDEEIESMDSVRDFLTNAQKDHLKRLKSAKSLGRTTYSNSDELPTLEEATTPAANSNNNSNNSQSIDAEIESMTAVRDFLTNAQKAHLKRLEHAKVLGRSTYSNSDELPTLEEATTPVANSNITEQDEQNPPKLLVQDALQIITDVLNNSTLEPRDESILRAKKEKLEQALQLGIESYTDEADLNAQLPARTATIQGHEILEEQLAEMLAGIQFPDMDDNLDEYESNDNAYGDEY